MDDVEDVLCEFSENGKCNHFLLEGELDCYGTENEKSKCMEYNEME